MGVLLLLWLEGRVPVGGLPPCVRQEG